MGIFFAIVLMLTVIVSLFPLIVIKTGKYMHGMCWEIRFWTIILIPLRFIDKKFVNHKVMWQAGCMMAFAVLLLVLELLLYIDW